VTLTEPGSAHQPLESVEVAVDIETGHSILLGMWELTEIVIAGAHPFTVLAEFL